MGGLGGGFGGYLRKEDSSFSEEKEAKRLLSVGGWMTGVAMGGVILAALLFMAGTVHARSKAPRSAKQTKVFWFFFAKKNAFFLPS
jgi:hypothetical protein